MKKKTIRPFGVKTNPSSARLKEFRNYVAQLKKQGILTGKIDPKVARPDFVRGGRKLGDIVNRHRDNLKPYTPRTTSSPSPVKTKTKKLPLRSPIAFRDLPLKGKSLGTALKEMSENAAEFDKLKERGEKFAFEIDGIRSVAVFPDMERLTHYLGTSAGIQHVLKKRGGEQDFIFKNIKLIRWNKTASEWKPHSQKWSREKLEHARRSRAAKQARNRRSKKK